MQPLQAATDVALVSGAFRRSIPVKEIEHLAKTGEVVFHQKGAMVPEGFRLYVALDKFPESGATVYPGSISFGLSAPKHSKLHAQS